MGLRQIINLAEAHLFKGMTGKAKDNLRALLNDKFDYELTEPERKRAERKRIAMETGAYQSQAALTGAFNLRGRKR